MKTKLLLVGLALTALSGCTRSLVANYNHGVSLSENKIESISLSVTKFEDTRAWIDSNDEKSGGFVAKQGPWKFGLTHDGIEYRPVSDILHSIFIEEFKSVGVNAFSHTDENSGDYVLGGKILNFEFENEEGVFTVTSRRHVSLALTLKNKDGDSILENELFNELDRENEGMGVMHSTNVDKLMSGALKKVVVSVIEKTNQELAYMGYSTSEVTLNGKDITPVMYTLLAAN